MAASLVLRRKEIPFSSDCLQVWVHVRKGPQHFKKLGHMCCDEQLVCSPLSLGAGVTIVDEENIHVPRKPLPGALAAITKGSRLRSASLGDQP